MAFVLKVAVCTAFAKKQSQVLVCAVAFHYEPNRLSDTHLGIGPMIRGNCDYIFLQPIYNATQRQTLWDLEAAVSFYFDTFVHFGSCLQIA